MELLLIPALVIAKRSAAIGIISGFHISDNAALRRPAAQKDIYRNIPGPPGRAVDGNKANNYFEHSCTHTPPMRNPWWVVQLDEPLNVVRVDIVNRGDCCREYKRFRDLLYNFFYIGKYSLINQLLFYSLW